LNSPKLSIITITYNSEATITATLDSMHEQSFQEFEYIVIDGASTDDTVSIIENHPVRVTHIISEPDKGLYDALNKGIRLATGEVIGVLHSDDIFFSKDSLHRISDVFEAGADACYGDLQYVVANNSPAEAKVVRQWIAGDFIRNNLKYGWMPPHPTFYMKRKLFEKFGAYDSSFKIAGDYDGLLRYLWKNDVVPTYIPEVLVRMKVGGASNRSLKNIYNKTVEDIRALTNNGLAWVPAILWKNLSKVPQFFKRSA
jgi:glycosyltransferase